jgi:membrane protein DedA with SNARE-associated domain
MIPPGFLAARGEFTGGDPTVALVFAIAAGTAGSLAGAYINYYLAAWVGKPFLEKYGRYFFVKPEPLARACEVFNRYGAMTTFVCRLVPVIRQLISIPAGISRMPFLSFTFFTGLGAGIWTAVLAFVGFAIGRSAGDISYVELVNRGKAAATANLPLVIASAVVLVVAYIFVSKLVMGRNARKG